MDYTPEMIEQKFNALPEDVKNVLSSEATALALNEIGTQNGLLEDRVDVLVNETGYILLGLSHPSQFVGNLATKMGVSRELAERIAKRINEVVFSPIRESLKKIHHIGTANTAPQGSVGASDIQKKLDSIADPANMQHADKLEKITMQPPEEIHAIDQGEKIYERPRSGTNDPYREPL